MTPLQADQLGEVLEALEDWLLALVFGRAGNVEERKTARENLIDAVDEFVAAMEGDGK